APGDDIEAGAQAGEYVQHTQVGVGLDRKAHQMGYAVQRLVPGQVGLLYGAAGVDVAGSAVLRGDAGQGNVFGVQLAVAVLEFTHAGFQFSVGCWIRASRAGSTGWPSVSSGR